jgi:hypothetical protein
VEPPTTLNALRATGLTIKLPRRAVETDSIELCFLLTSPRHLRHENLEYRL